MAKENFVSLHGQIQVAPKIYATTEGTLTKAMFILKVLRRPTVNGQFFQNKLYFDCPIVLTKNENMIKKCSDLQINDMVDIRGVLTTKEVRKTTICPSCKEKTSTNGNAVYVTPIYICRREETVTPEKGLEFLKERSEISNLVMVIGTLCRDPEIYTNEKEQSFAQYQLAVNRKYHIREDPDDIKTDYPWVKTFGKQALEDSYGLKMGSVVYISGALQTREINKERVCAHCGETYSWSDNATEIVPYSIEYLENCIIPEKKEESITDAEESTNGES